MPVGIDDGVDIETVGEDQHLLARIAAHLLPPLDDLFPTFDRRRTVGTETRPVCHPFRRVAQESRRAEGIRQYDQQVAAIKPVPVLQNLIGCCSQLLIRLRQRRDHHRQFMRVRADGFEIGIHGEQDVTRTGKGGPDAFLQRFDAPALPKEAVAATGAEIGNAQARQLPQPLHLLPHLGLCAGIKHIEREITERAHGAARAQLVDDGERRDFPERRVHPAAMKIQLILPVALEKLIFRQLIARQPGEEFRLENLRAAVKRVTRKPDVFLFGKTQGACMIELFAQLHLVDFFRQPHRLRAVDQRKRRVDLRIELPDHLQHQELVEIRIDQAADDRVEFPGMIMDTGGYIGLRHTRIPQYRPKVRIADVTPHPGRYQPVMRKIYLKKRQQVQSTGQANARRHRPRIDFPKSAMGFSVRCWSDAASEGRVYGVYAGIPVLGNRVSAAEAGNSVFIGAAVTLNGKSTAAKNIPVGAARISGRAKSAVAIVTDLWLQRARILDAGQVCIGIRCGGKTVLENSLRLRRRAQQNRREDRCQSCRRSCLHRCRSRTIIQPM